MSGEMMRVRKQLSLNHCCRVDILTLLRSPSLSVTHPTVVSSFSVRSTSHSSMDRRQDIVNCRGKHRKIYINPVPLKPLSTGRMSQHVPSFVRIFISVETTTEDDVIANKQLGQDNSQPLGFWRLWANKSTQSSKTSDRSLHGVFWWLRDGNKAGAMLANVPH